MKKGQQKVLIFVFFALVALGGIALAPFASAQDSQAQAKLSNDYQKALGIIQQNYVIELDDETLTKASIQGMLKTLDPHSDYMDRKTYEEFKEKQSSEYYGIGSAIGSRNRPLVTFILEPFKNSPAAKAGLRYGDQIVAVDGKDTSSWDSNKVRDLLLGQRGTDVTVTVKRPGAPEPITVKITRDAISYPSIPSYYLVKPNVGYIGLTRNFQLTTSDELTNAMAELRAKGAESFILDLRNNGGGYLDQAIKVLDSLLQQGQTIVTVRGRAGKGVDQEATAERGAKENFPLVVLTDHGTASASEIVSGAIQDHDRGLIIGERTFGKGLVQRIFPMSNGGALTLTIAHYYTPSGRLIQRDYSNGSLFDYYLRRSLDGDSEQEPKNTADEKKTDLGRTVYGGGGIEPDIKIDSKSFFSPDNISSTQNRLYYAIFMFTRQLVNGQIEGHTEFKTNGLDFDHQLKPNEFAVNDSLLNVFRQFALNYGKEHPEAEITSKLIEENIDWVRTRIRWEALMAAYGTAKANQGVDSQDAQLQRAITEMPAAADLAKRSWHENTAKQNSSSRHSQK